MRIGRGTSAVFALLVIAASAAPSPVMAASSGSGPAAAQTSATSAVASPTAALWHPVYGVTASVLATEGADLRPSRFRSFTLDRAGMLAALRPVPMQRFGAVASDTAPVVLSLPDPDGTFQRFSVQESPVMMPALARKHPDIKTYDGRGVDDPTANIRFAMTPLGFSGSVRSDRGMWYVEPSNHLSQSLYLSYYGQNLPDTHGRFIDHGSREVLNAMDHASVSPFANLSVGPQLRNYRLALVSDPTYADYWGAANVTTGKVLLVNRIDQVYEQELGIHMDLAANNDLLNFNTDALATGTNGPCGAVACYGTDDFYDCNSDPNQLVMGLSVGAGNYDIGHMISALDSGGLSSEGIVGLPAKGQSCTGLSDPIGDEYVVGYVAHEMGHEFNADHTWDATLGSCSSDQYARTDAVEPGSGSTIMSYAGICGADDIQPNADPYFSQKSFENITSYVSSAQSANNEVQTAAMIGFGGADSFQLTYNGNTSALITNGTNYTAAGIKAAIQAISGWPAGGVVTVAGYSGGGSPNASGFQITYSGTLAASANVGVLSFTNPTGFTGVIGCITKGGPATNGGFTVTATGNSAPVVTAPSSYTIPYQTPFTLTGSSTDADADTVTYSWEQNDIGPPTPTKLRSATKFVGPLFRMFGSTPSGTYDPLATPSGGTNATTSDPSRTFPDIAQIAANNTDAETGTCPVTASIVECWAEFLPTSIYAGPMHFRLTARDGHPGAGGVSSADTTVSLATGTGPFLVTSPNTAVSWIGGTTQTVAWNVAGTSAAPISAANVSITLSTDGGLTYPVTLLASTPNDGSETITLPNNVTTATARIKVQAVGNVFFDISDANFSLTCLSCTQTISFGALANRTFGDPDFSVSATATSGLPVSFTAGGQCTVTPTGSVVHLTGAGSCTITASQPGDGNDQAAPDVPQTFSIGKSDQSITFGPLADHVLSDPDFSVSASTSSGLAATFTAFGNCTVTSSGSVLHMTAIGACTITAHQSGDGNYNAAVDAPQSFTILRGSQTISFAPIPDHTIVDPNFSVSATATSGLAVSFTATGSCTVTPSGSAVDVAALGPCTVTAHQFGNANYFPATDVPQTFNVTMADQTISFSAIPDHQVNDPDFSVSATASSGLSVSFTAEGNCTVTADGTLVHMLATGSCTITAHQSGDDDYNAAPGVARSFNIMAVLTHTTTTVKLKPAKVKHGRKVKFTATVKQVSGSHKPAGVLEIEIDNLVVGSGSLNAKGVLAISIVINQTVGTHVVTAVYLGAGTFAGSTSAPHNLVVT